MCSGFQLSSACWVTNTAIHMFFFSSFFAVYAQKWESGHKKIVTFSWHTSHRFSKMQSLSNKSVFGDLSGLFSLHREGFILTDPSVHTLYLYEHAADSCLIDNFQSHHSNQWLSSMSLCNTMLVWKLSTVLKKHNVYDGWFCRYSQGL